MFLLESSQNIRIYSVFILNLENLESRPSQGKPGIVKEKSFISNSRKSQGKQVLSRLSVNVDFINLHCAVASICLPVFVNV